MSAATDNINKLNYHAFSVSVTTESSLFADFFTGGGNRSENSTNINISQTFVKPSPLPSAITFTLGVVGNLIAIYVLVRASEKHKWNVFYRFVTALVVTDLFGILTTSPVAFAAYDNNFKWVGGQPLCDYMSFMMIFSGLATVLLAGAMAFDRYLAIIHPFKCNNPAKFKIVKFVLAGIWAFSAFVALLPLFGLGENVKQFPPTWCFFNFFGDRIADHIYSYFYCFLGLGTIAMTAILNILVIRGLMTGKRSQIRRGSVSNRKARAKADVYITIFLVAIFIVFAVCWAPFLVRIVINQSHSFPRDIKADLLTLRLATLNQILDPWVYILFRREMLSRISHCLRKKRKGTLFRRLTSIASSFRSNTSSTDTSSHGTSGTPITQRRNIVSFVSKLPRENNISDEECRIDIHDNGISDGKTENER